MLNFFRVTMLLIATVFAGLTASAAPLIEQANVIDGNTYLPAVKVNGEVYATPYRFGTTAEAEQWVLANLGIVAVASRNIGGVDEDANGDVTGSGSGF